ncbi:cardiolipin synthase [Pseudoduganella sp. GCM10020061]|uniref:cardiolipin synthase n=1 Tax=Pseudoduganella sp. GCM10020061 TaxID=3317345 RepID=UPI003627E5A6
MKSRLTALFASLLLLASMIGGCTTLPHVPDKRAPAASVPTVTGLNGELKPSVAREMLEERWTHASRDLKALATLEEAATGVPLIAGNNVSLLFDGPQTMNAMMDAVRGAKETINLETYIFDQDEVGMRFANLLIERQRAGVRVNVMYDSVGTIGVPPEFFERMRAAGITLLAFNPINPAKARGKWAINNRDHRKLLVVDGKVAFTGGINISEDYANSSLFRSRRRPPASAEVGWRDTHIRIEGPAVAALQWSFIDNWVNQVAGDLPEANYFPKLKPVGDKMLRVLATRPNTGFEIYKAFMVAIQEAKKSIHITSAYFVPDKQIIEALGAAAKRGVDVQLILPSRTDHGIVADAGRATYDRLLGSGVRIFELQVAVLHAKTAVIDGAWSTVGSANIDRRSFLHNYELNVIVIDPAFGREMEAAFTEDLRNSNEVTLANWRKRPVTERFKEWAAQLLGYWL